MPKPTKTQSPRTAIIGTAASRAGATTDDPVEEKTMNAHAKIQMTDDANTLPDDPSNCCQVILDELRPVMEWPNVILPEDFAGLTVALCEGKPDFLTNARGGLLILGAQAEDAAKIYHGAVKRVWELARHGTGSYRGGKPTAPTDPALVAFENWRAALVKHIKIEDEGPSDDCPAELAAYDATHDTASALADVEPTTPAGLAAQLRFGFYALGEQKAREGWGPAECYYDPDFYEFPHWDDDRGGRLMRSMLAGAEQMAEGPGTESLHRRTARVSIAASPLLETPSLASSPNATDAAWAAYRAAKAKHRTARQASDALEDTLPPDLRLEALPQAIHGSPAKLDAFESARSETGATAVDNARDDAVNRECRAEMDVVRTPAATLTDLDRKLCILLTDYLDQDDWPWSVVTQLRADLAALDPALAADHQSSPG